MGNVPDQVVDLWKCLLGKNGHGEEEGRPGTMAGDPGQGCKPQATMAVQWLIKGLVTQKPRWGAIHITPRPLGIPSGKNSSQQNH